MVRRCWECPRPSSVPEPLAQHTTLRLGGPARRWVEASTEADLIDAVRTADEAGESVLLISGGSNLVVGDSGFDGTVVHVATRGVESDSDSPDDLACLGAVTLTVAAGEDWDAVVEYCVQQGYIGVEALSGIPGAVGSTPIQNVGAYGQEVSQTIARVRTWDRVNQTQRTFFASDCGFGYRDSVFKANPGRYLVLEVQFLFKKGDFGGPVVYAELARALGIEVGGIAPVGDVRDAVLSLRRSKGMVLDLSDHDTWSAGSFFTNPLLDADTAATLPEEAPQWEQPDGRVKTSAAWLIEHAGFGKGHGLESTAGPGGGRVALSTKHTLALTNRGSASTADLLALALEVRDGVALAYGIELVPEPVLVGCSL